MGQEGITWAGRALHGTLPGVGGRYLGAGGSYQGWEGASWVRRALPSVGGCYLV